MMDKTKLNEIFGKLDKTGVVAILIHPSPDPDALGSAAGFSVLLKKVFGLNSKILYTGTISHPQNKSLKNVLHIPLEDGRKIDKETFSSIVVLDTDLVGTGMVDAGELNQIEADVRIDHHSIARGNVAEYEDVRVVGSTCSIVWEYLREFGVALEDHPDCATAMVIGIKTDTLDFTSTNTTDLDMEAFRSLLPFVDKVLLSKVMKYPMPKYYFETEIKAFKDKEVRNTTLISFVGEVNAHNRDVIPTIADRFMRMDGITTTAIMGVIDGMIVASVRSVDSRVDVCDMCANVFGREYSGGKDGSGGARFPLGFGFGLIEDEAAKQTAMNEIFLRLKNKIFEALGERLEKE